MNKFKGILYAAVSSSSFGLAPFFSILLIAEGFSTFEVLIYRWGVAAGILTLSGLISGINFKLSKQEIGSVLVLSVLRALTSFSLIIAYINIASGVASTIHFMYPLVVSLSMMFLFNEKKSVGILTAVLISLAGTILLASDNLSSPQGNTVCGFIAAGVSVFSYAGYIVAVRKTRAAKINSTALTCYVMIFGTIFYITGASFTSGVRLVTDHNQWLIILGLALPATALSNITLVKAIKHAGPTLTSILGALEPLTAVIIGVSVFGEPFTVKTMIGISLIIAAVVIVFTKRKTPNIE